MTLKGVLNGRVVEIELTEEQVIALSKRHTGWELVEENKRFWMLGIDGTICNWKKEGDKFDAKLFAKANYFSDEKLSNDVDRAQRLQRYLWRRSAELCNKTDWNKTDKQYYIDYDYTFHTLTVRNCSSRRHFGQVYFDTYDHAKQIMGEYRDDLLWYFTEFETRID